MLTFARWINEEEDYRGHDAPPSPKTGSPMHNVCLNGHYSDDVYGPHGAQYFGTGDDKLDSHVHRLIRSCRNQPDKAVKIYRGVPPDLPKSKQRINANDFVTPHRSIAREHGKILSKTVKAKHLFADGDSWHEWGYHPD